MKKKYGFLFEAVFGLVALMLINIIWFRDNIGFIGVSPHPYWIVAIFIAARYGSMQGMIAGILCSATLMLCVSYDQLVVQRLESIQLPYKQVQLGALFIFFGFLVGEERRRANKILSDWRERYVKLQNEFGNLALDNMACKDINVELEGRILGQVDTVNTLYDAARSLATLRVQDLYPSIIRIINKVIGPERCSLYIWEDEKYVLRGHSGWGADIKEREVLTLDSDIVKLAHDERRLVTVKDVIKKDNLKWEEGKDAPMVAPLFFGGGDNPVGGFIIIDDISFLKLNPDSIRFLSILSDWISKSLDNIYSVTTVRLKDYYDEEMELFNFDYAMRRIKEEFLNARVSGKPSAMMLIKLKEYDTITPDLKKDVTKVMGSLLKNTFRASDVVARYTEDGMFIAVFPGTDSEGAKIITNRLQEEINKFEFKPFKEEKKKISVDVSTQLIKPEGVTENQLIKNAEKDLLK